MATQVSAIAVPSESIEEGRFPPRVDGRIPSLDGLRAVAIFLVMESHLAGGQYNLFGLAQGRFPERFMYGNLGVRVFFVLSGFLITTLLLQEKEKSGQISLAQFYIRRSLRILPASYAFLLIMAIATTAGILEIPKSDFLASILYVRNYLGTIDWYTGHLWSLSVEEQFYLLWPAVMILLGKRGAMLAAACTLPIAVLMRLYRPIGAFETNMDALACGCLLACLWGPIGGNERYQKLMRSWFFWTIPIATIACMKLNSVGNLPFAMGNGISDLLIAISVERLVRNHRTPSARLLNMRVPVFIGTLSYSLYLWQEPWIVMRGGNGLLQSFPLDVCLAVTCAFLSYKFVERPFLRLRDKHKILLS